MIDHTGINVSDFEKSKAFYSQALKCIRYEALVVLPADVAGVNVAGFGEAPKPDFWIAEGAPQKPHVHIAFRAETRAQVDEFYKAMEQQEAHFKSLFDDATAAGCTLKFVASFNEGKASVGLQHIDPKHDLYHLYGKDNVVLFYTERYKDQPLVIKGAGAGADVTASGVFADMLRAVK